MAEPLPPSESEALAQPETAPPAAPPPAKAALRGRRINWHRVRVYFWSLMLMAAMWACGGVYTIRHHPKRIVNAMLAQVPFPSSTGRVFWLNRRTLEIDEVRLGDPNDPKKQFFLADSIVLTASPWGLWRHHLAKVQVIGGQVYTRALYDALDRVGPGSGKGIDWVIGRLELRRGMVLLDNLLPDTAIPVRLGVRYPIVLRALRLGAPDSSREMNQEQIVEIGAVNIGSPVDPFVRVFNFPLTRVRFTYAELWRHRIREIELVRPTMYLGEDLFWLTKQFQASGPAPVKGPQAPWYVDQFEVQFGQLAVNAFGEPVARLPFFVDTKVENIRLDQIDKISAKAKVPIQNLTQAYPDYKVNIVNLSGQLYFSWPPSDAKANNVVNYIHIDAISWNGIAAKDVYSSVTFDPQGVYGKLTNATCEGGLLNGNFEFYYTKGFTWNADFFAQKVNCQPIAQKLVGKYVDLTGQLDGQINVQGQATDIQHCSGLLRLPNPGKLEIKSMNDLINRIPADMLAMKRDAMKIAINAFRTYPYDQGSLSLNYKPTGGTGSLKLTGPLGKREFDVVLHPYVVAKGEAAPVKTAIPAVLPKSDGTVKASTED